jgi:pyruvate,water dikinase
MTDKKKFIYWFKEIDKDDVGLVGGKGANLGEMTKMGLPVPPGFIVSASAYFHFVEENKLLDKIKGYLKYVDANEPSSYQVASQKIKALFEKGRMPKELALEIMKAYLKVGTKLKHPLVAIRSSATAEDLPEASFAGQQETFLNVKGEVNVVNRVRDCFASLFEPRAIFYREQQGFDHFKVGLAAIVQKMIQADSSGVMFTIDPVTNQKNRILIEAIYGLGELLVQGAVTPDRYLVDKNSLKTLEKEVSTQLIQLIKVGSLNKRAKVPKKKQEEPKLTPSQVKELAKFGKKVHQHYYFPQDLEWAVEKGKIYILQTRPVTTVKKRKEQRKMQEVKTEEKAILKGQGASPGIGTGRVKIIKSAKEINKVDKGDVLVTKMTTPDFVPAMKKVAAIVTDSGGQTSHAAIVSRELGIPCVVGTKEGTKKLRTLKFITVNGSTGEIFKGKTKTSKTIEWKGVEEKKRPIDRVREEKALKTATKVMVNLAEPELAEDLAQKNVDGVGLLRAEFMMSQIGTHPKKIIEDKKGKAFIKQLKEGIQKIVQAFAPRPVIYRASDFKTNEYRHLTGGKKFEPTEENPFIGYRGAFRYLSEPKVFGLELEAIKLVRKAGFKNLWLMIPFVHQVRELKEVKKVIAGKNLLRSPSFQLWMMVEVPSNVILLEDFIKIGIDGVSIGSNDLTMLLLGVDRDNAELANVFNERDPAVLWALERVIKIARKSKISCSICGQAPSQYPDLVEKLVEWGISSVSVNPDAIETTREIVYHAEGKKIKK